MSDKLELIRTSADDKTLSNEYYRDGFRTILRIVNIEAVIIFGLSIALSAYLVTRSSGDHFFAETNDNNVFRMQRLSSPNMGRMAISSWAAAAASEVMTFGFNDVDERFRLSRRHFTPQGWENFRKAVMNSKLIEEMNSTQQILTSVPQDVPVLNKEGLINGVYTWELDVPLLVTFRAGGKKSSRPKTVHLTIEKVPTGQNPSGVGISQWVIY